MITLLFALSLAAVPHAAAHEPPIEATLPEGVALVDANGNGRLDGVEIKHGRYRVDADGGGVVREGPEEPSRLSVLPNVFANATDTLQTVIYPKSSVTLTAPDGARLRIHGAQDSLLYVVVALDGTVKDVYELGFYFTRCDPVEPSVVRVDGGLVGAAADGTWLFERSGDFVLNVQGKRWLQAYFPQDFEEGACPTTNTWDVVKRHTWNWHMTEREHRVGTATAASPEENPALARFFLYG